MKDLKEFTKRMKERIDIGEIKEKIVEKTSVESVVGVSEKIKEKIDASGIKEKVRDIGEKVKVGSMVEGIQKGMSKISLGEKSILAFSKTCSRKHIEIGETVTVTIKLQSRYEKGVLDCIVTDEIPPQFELIEDMPVMIYQLKPGEEKEYQYKIRANVGGHFSTRAMCEIENKFSLDDIPSNDMEIYVSPLSIQMKTVEMTQGKWEEVGFIFKNISKETMMGMTVSLKQDSKFELDKVQTYNKPLTPSQSVVVPLVLKTEESGSVSLDLDVTCIDENGKNYNTEKNFLVPVKESDKTTTKVDIGTIGEIVASGATQIKESVIQRSTVGRAETKREGEPSVRSNSVEVSGSIVERSEISGGMGATEAGRICPKCSNRVQEGWKICPFCGTKLELKCPNCGQRVEEKWHVCPFCGEKLG